MLILGGYVTGNANDKKEMALAVSSVDEGVREIDTICVDTGFYSEDAIAAVEKINEEGEREGTEVFCAVEKVDFTPIGAHS